MLEGEVVPGVEIPQCQAFVVPRRDLRQKGEKVHGKVVVELLGLFARASCRGGARGFSHRGGPEEGKKRGGGEGGGGGVRGPLGTIPRATCCCVEGKGRTVAAKAELGGVGLQLQLGMPQVEPVGQCAASADASQTAAPRQRSAGCAGSRARAADSRGLLLRFRLACRRKVEQVAHRCVAAGVRVHAMKRPLRRPCLLTAGVPGQRAPHVGIAHEG
mmetsp:Transcript_12594/g.45959  ORF Transcript_12594/g.45959 Transcript_12594/m.45959 type:complete len:216 (+) Transcript_12594:2984-3631(+)